MKRSAKLTLVDLTPKCIDICKERFKEFDNIDYIVNDGKDLSVVPDASIDCIWSWDVFVHIDAGDIRNYMREFSRVLSPGGHGTIHHSKNGKSNTGWRSNMTTEKMKIYCAEYGFRLIRQFDSWDNDQVHIWPTLAPHAGPDIISIFEKPTAGR